MSILTIFVVIPVLMLLGLWLARTLNQVRTVMVVGASLLLAMSIYLTIDFIHLRALKLAFSAPSARSTERAPERRCSSRTFRYGYLVTT